MFFRSTLVGEDKYTQLFFFLFCQLLPIYIFIVESCERHHWKVCPAQKINLNRFFDFCFLQGATETEIYVHVSLTSVVLLIFIVEFDQQMMIKLLTITLLVLTFKDKEDLLNCLNQLFRICGNFRLPKFLSPN